ncbi:MAG: hypothetical protein ACOYJK_07670 [Prevotella sp.]|jgi:hypothetical protein
MNHILIAHTFKRLISTVLLVCAASTLHAQIVHIDVSGGLQYFHGMSKKVGWDYNVGGRLLIFDNWYAAALVHGGFSRGHYTGIYANEETQLKHERDAFFLGVGPGYSIPLHKDWYATAQILGGWGSIETTGNSKQKEVDDVDSHTFKGLSAASVIGVEYRIGSCAFGVNITTQYIDQKLLPSLNLKCGLDFVL